MERREVANRYFCPRPAEEPADWCCEHLHFSEPTNTGPFSLNGCEYNREPLNSFKDDSISDRVLVYGSQAKKTGTLMGGALWGTVRVGLRLFWVMPSITQAMKFSRTRLQPMCHASKPVARLIPTGTRRHDFKTLEMHLGRSIIDFAGSNSPANLASTPANWVFQDEVDKFDAGTRGEADAVNLADQRCKDQANAKRAKTSTPTLEDGLIWQEFLKTDQRRRYMPCPTCGEFIALAWGPQFTVFPDPANAFVRWDDNARLKDHKWDLDLVKRTAHAVCPFCRGEIRDSDKTKMDKLGQWRPTATASRGFRGWHLPSLYASSPNTTFGNLAVKFLQAKYSLQGVQGFVNGDLAEPYEGQDTMSNRVEIITNSQTADSLGEKTIRILTVDNQQLVPHRWYVARDWALGGHSRLVEQGSCNEWTELEAIQRRLGIQDIWVGLDCGNQDGKESKYESDIYSACLAHGQLARKFNRRRAKHVGWWPMRGQRRSWFYKDKKGRRRPYGLQLASIPRPDITLQQILFNSETMLDLLDKLRQGPDIAAGIRWELTEAADTTYRKHLEGRVKGPLKNGQTWHPRSERWPDHLLDCEKMQVALALATGLLPWGPIDAPEPGENQ